MLALAKPMTMDDRVSVALTQCPESSRPPRGAGVGCRSNRKATAGEECGQYHRVVRSGPADAIETVSGADHVVQMRWSQGELGRPGDNLYRVTFVLERPHKLLVEFDEQVLMVLTQPRLARASEIEAVIEYAQLTMDRQGHGDMTPYCDPFGPGEFTVYRQGI